LPSAHIASSTAQREPLAKVGSEGIEVEVEPVTGKERKTARGQALSESVDERMCHVLRAGTEFKHRKKLRARIDGQPEPEHLCVAAHPAAQFVQLHVWELEMAEIVFVQHLSVLASAREPGRNGRLSVVENTFSRGSVQPFGECREHHCNLV